MQHVVPLQEGTVWVPLAQPCTGLSSRKWGSVYICVPVSILVHFANHEPSWTLVEKPLPLNRGRCIKVPGRYWCLRSCPRWCKHLLWPRPQVLSNHFGPRVGRYSYHRMLRLLWWWDMVSIEDGDDSVMTITTQWWPSLWSMLDVEWAADYGDYGDYSDCWRTSQYPGILHLHQCSRLAGEIYVYLPNSRMLWGLQP